MSNQAAITDHNPFATRHVRPGAIPFRFAAGIDAAGVIERLATADWRGQIIGPHGSGKSTLLAALIPAIESHGRCPILITLHDRQRSLPAGWPASQIGTAPMVIVVDGYEQLSRWRRWRLKRFCRRRGCGLLVTAHRSVGLPTVFETVTTPELAQQIVDRLTGGQATIHSAEIVASFRARAGNLRELLFDCYNLHRRRSR